MSYRTPQHQTLIRWTPLVAASVFLAVVLVLTACEPGSGSSGVDTTPVQTGGEVEFSARCDETGFAYDIEPDTQEAYQAAREYCRSLDAAIENAPWPSGFRPTGPVAVER
ncbi:hypothetical protein [Saccharothrix sp.]|uniref:hypothetical protein n=1 Tax=Saccharothrix sp. TaxID=1873460 RepID=UPI002811492B|nr:hypothetical protein [Saccharothrix sp.]